MKTMLQQAFSWAAAILSVYCAAISVLAARDSEWMIAGAFLALTLTLTIAERIADKIVLVAVPRNSKWTFQLATGEGGAKTNTETEQ